MNPIDRLPPGLQALVRWVLGWRYAKFAIVGATGAVVNSAVLWLGQNHLFTVIEPASQRLYGSLAFAIFIATINNFTWNRLWTWADRYQREAQAAGGQTSLLAQFGRYALASWLGISLHYGLTIVLSDKLHYLVASLVGIFVASISNFLINNYWTFRKPRGE